MTDQGQQQGQGGQGQQGQRRERREPPRLVVTHHEFGRRIKKPATVNDPFQNSVTVWVSQENHTAQEEIYCSFRVNRGAPTQEQLLGNDWTCTEILRFRGMRPHVEIMLRWRLEQNPRWRALGYMEFRDPYRDINDELLLQRMFIRLWDWLFPNQQNNP